MQCILEIKIKQVFMKVLLVNHVMDASIGGGTAERTSQIARFLALTGVDCAILSLDIGSLNGLQEKLGNVRLVTLPCCNKRFFLPKISWRLICSLVTDSDIVHLSGHWTILNVLVFLACQRLAKPYVFNPAGALQPFGRSLFAKKLYNALIGRMIVKRAAMCVAITKDECSDFVEFGALSTRVSVIPNGIDPDQYLEPDLEDSKETLIKFTKFRNKPYILFLGRLNPIKGPDLLLEAFFRIAKKFPQHQLVLAGPNGGLLDELKSTARQYGIAERVHFPGFISNNEKTIALRRATLLVIPSRREAMSIVVLEAGACQCPVLFTDTCGLSNLADLDAGIMVSVDVNAIAAALEALLTSTEKLKESADRLSKLVANEYLWSVQAQRYTSLFSKISGES
jgi:glycosyltransferase involved in cell wall biosynthesis